MAGDGHDAETRRTHLRPTTGPNRQPRAKRHSTTSSPARPRGDRGEPLPRHLPRREPPARVRRAGGRAGAGRGGPHDRRARPSRAFAARLLPAAGRPDRADPLRGRPHPRRAQLLDTSRRRHPARQGHLQPAGQLPRRRAGPRPPAHDAGGDGPSRGPRRLPHPHGAVRRAARRVVPPPTTDRPPLRRRRPDQQEGHARRPPSTCGCERTDRCRTTRCCTPASSRMPAT